MSKAKTKRTAAELEFEARLKQQKRNWTRPTEPFVFVTQTKRKIRFLPDFYLPKEKRYIDIPASRQAFYNNKLKYALFKTFYPKFLLDVFTPEGKPYDLETPAIDRSRITVLERKALAGKAFAGIPLGNLRQIMMTNLERLRRQKRLSMRELAADLGIRLGVYNDLEQGLRLPRLLEAKAIADYYGIKIEDLLIGQKNPVKPLPFRLRSSQAKAGVSDPERKKQAVKKRAKDGMRVR